MEQDKFPPADRAALHAEVVSRTGGAPFRFVVDGKLAERETAARIAALVDGEPVAPFVVINGREVEPVGLELEEAVEDDEDPFDPGVALGQPGAVSRKLGISLERLNLETRQVLRLVYEHDLSDASLSELRKAVAWAAGKPVMDIVNSYALVHRGWSRLSKSLPKLKVARRRPFVAEAAEPPPAVAAAAKPVAVSIFVLGAREESAAADALKKHLTPSARSGLLSIQSDADCPAGYDRQAWITQRLSEASIVVLLMSADTICKFYVSGFAGRLVPLLVRHCAWKDVPELSRYGILPRNQRPVDGDVGWTTVAAEFVAHAKRLAGR